jgi:putative transposase
VRDLPQAQKRNSYKSSLRYVSLKERKAMPKVLRLIYEAATEEVGSAALEQFSEKLFKRYPHVSSSWKENWAEIATFFKYPPEVRTFIHTTNPIESVHRTRFKKVANNKSSFSNEQSLVKLV